MKPRLACVVAGFLSFVLSVAAQTASNSSASAQVPPPLIQFSNVATDEDGNTLSGVVNITFSLYNAQQGGEPLWSETQNNVQLDPTGHYSVQLGITKPNGVPTTLFTTGEARWLGVQIAERGEQPRVLLLSVPYALKAGDAATIGGLPPSAFVLAALPSGAVSAYPSEAATEQSAQPPSAADVTTTGGTVNFLPRFNGTSTIIDSVVFQSAASPFKIGINTTTPATTLDVKGAGTIRGTLGLPATAVATATKGASSQPLTLAASAFSSTTSTAINQTFQWQAEPAANDTTAPSGTLNLLFGIGATKPSETGLHIASNGQVTFATGQTFPGTGTGNGSVTSVASGAGLTGGPITASGTLSIATGGVSNTMLANPSLTVKAGTDLIGGGLVALGGTTALNVDTTKIPQLSTANTFAANQTVNANLYVNGLFGTGVILTGSAPTFMGAGNNPNGGGSGNSLTVSGGSAAVAASNAPGGDLILAAGNGNGLGGSGNVRVQVASSGPTGTAADSLVDRQFIAAAPINMGGQDGVSSYFMLNFGDFTAGAINVRFTIYAIGGSNEAFATGSCLFLAGGADPAETITYSVLFGADHIDIGNSGGLNVNPGCGAVFFQGSSATLDGVAIVDSLTFDPSTLHTMYYQIENISGLPLTIQPQNPNSADRVAPRADRLADALHPRVNGTIHR
jgi:hypothetical protein